MSGCGSAAVEASGSCKVGFIVNSAHSLNGPTPLFGTNVARVVAAADATLVCPVYGFALHEPRELVGQQRAV